MTGGPTCSSYKGKGSRPRRALDVGGAGCRTPELQRRRRQLDVDESRRGDSDQYRLAMLGRAFGDVGKTWKRTLHMSIQAYTSPRRRSHMPPQLRHLHSRPERQENFLQPLQNNSRETVDGSFDQRFATLKSIGEDRVNDRELKLLLKNKPAPVCYVWCDPSPWMHISQGIMKTLSINKMVKSGFKVKILMADWFARMNDEIGGNLSKMRAIGMYNIEMWKAIGMALDEVELVWLSDEVSLHGDEYWPLVMDIARKNSVRRIRRSSYFCLPSRFSGVKYPYAMGHLNVAEQFYPCLQCAAMLFQKADLWLLGINQHDANLVARQYYKHVKRTSMPIAVSYNMLPNLLQYPEMENRRHPAWAIFMEDDKEDICFKIEKAFCPPKLAEGNPCLEYIKYIILPWLGKFEVVRKKENGGKKTFLSMEELTADYESGALHPAHVKLALVKSLNKILQPVHNHFGRSAEAKDLVEAIKEYYVAD